MIFLDFSQVAVACSIVNFTHNGWIEFALLRKQLLGTLKETNKRDRGELVICFDDDNGYWRKEYFPYYKLNRRLNDNIDWAAISIAIKKLKAEITENLPYRSIQVEHAEADDVIGTLCEHLGCETSLNNIEPILIVSGDRDFLQLHKYSNVRQYDPVHKIMVGTARPDLNLKEKILTGDSGDGIPNFLSPDNSFAAKIRQKPLTKKKIAEYLNQDPALFCDENTSKYYERNKKLIDLGNTPEEIKLKVIESYEKQESKPKNRKKFFDYLVNAGLHEHILNISEF